MQSRGPDSLFCIWLSSCPSTVHCKYYSFRVESSWHLVENQLAIYMVFISGFSFVCLSSHLGHIFLSPHFDWLCGCSYELDEIAVFLNLDKLVLCRSDLCVDCVPDGLWQANLSWRKHVWCLMCHLARRGEFWACQSSVRDCVVASCCFLCS